MEHQQVGELLWSREPCPAHHSLPRECLPRVFHGGLLWQLPKSVVNPGPKCSGWALSRLLTQGEAVCVPLVLLGLGHCLTPHSFL